MLAIALLTLVPGELGGSESSTREMLRALARVGTLDYRVFLPPVAPEAAEGLPTEVVPEYRRARSIPERLAAMGLAAARPGPIRAHLEGADAVHYPLTIRIPPVSAPSAITSMTSSTSICRTSSRAASGRSGPSPTTARRGRRGS